MGISSDTTADRLSHAGAQRSMALAPQRRPRPEARMRYQQLADSDRGTGGESLANFLGLFSIGLGLAQVVAPAGCRKLVGIDDGDGNAQLMRLLGMREITHGIAMLSKQQPEKAVWSRVAGDALDLALLGRGTREPEQQSRSHALRHGERAGRHRARRHVRQAAVEAAGDGGERGRRRRHHPHQAKHHDRQAGGGGVCLLA